MKQINPRSRGILLVSNTFSAGDSYGSVSKELSNNLSSKNWLVTTTSSVSNRYMRVFDMIATILRKRKIIDVAQIDIFSGSAFIWAEVTAWVLRRLGKPYILTLRGGNLPNFAAMHTRRVHSLLSSASIVTTLSNYLLDEMTIYRNDIVLIPNPLYIQNYSFQIRERPEAKLLFLRAIHKVYNPTLAVYTLKQLIHEYPSINLTIVGPDKGDGTAEEIYREIEYANLEDRISVIGVVHKSNVPNWLEKSDIFLNTTNFDNTPISVLEAMASGLCIVSTNVGGIPYLLTHEHDALLVPPNDPKAMANAVKRILTEPDLARRLSRNARTTAEQFDWSVILPMWEDLFTDILAKQNYALDS